MKKFKSLHKIILLILSLLLGFLAVELILRVAKVEYPVFQTFDVNRGFSLRPNTSGWWTREGKAFVKINSDGLRDKEYSKNKKSNIIRIALLGDSFAEARSIKLEKTFWSLLEKNLNTCKKDKQKKIEIINFGVTEYGTTQQYLTLIHHAWDYDPDIIILAFFSGNDISDNSKILSKKKYRPYFIFENNKLVIDNSFRKSKPYLLLKSNFGQIIINLSNYSRVIQFLREIYVKNYFKKQNKVKNNIEKINEPGLSLHNLYNPSNPSWQKAWNITEHVIRMINKNVKENKKEFILISLSNSLQVHPDADFREKNKKKLNIQDLFYPEKRIKLLGENDGFKVINLAEKLQKYAEKNKIFLHGFENNVMGEGHWNELGHKIASNIISKEFCKNF